MKNKIEIIKADITNLDVDGIVNAANNTLLGGGGVDGAIHRKGGPLILKQCKKIGGCPTGEARITTAGNLKAKYIIHTVGPIYKGGNNNEAKLLSMAYSSSIKLADEYKLTTIAFPFISAGAYAYPKDEAANIALSSIIQGLKSTNIEKVYFVLFNEEDYRLVNNLYKKIDI